MSTRYNQPNHVYVIAEVGINHNGQLDEAKALLRAAAEAGADAVKIQVRDLESIYTRTVLDDPLRAEHGTQYLLSELKRAHLSYDEVRDLFQFARNFAVDFFATPFDIKSARFLNDLGMEMFKIGSPDLTNLPLLDVVAGFQKPIILSTGMSEESEILHAVDFLRAKKCDFALLHCNSTYPATYSDINLRYLQVLKAKTGRRVGYSGHEQGYGPTLAAVALGAEIVERHITRDPTQPGPDHRASLAPQEFRHMVEAIRAVEQALGVPVKRLTQGERNNRLALAKSLVAARDLKAGHELAPEDVVAKTPAKGVSPLELPGLLGRRLVRDVSRDAYLTPDLVSEAAKPAAPPYRIRGRWGVIGRLNDFHEFLPWGPQIVEIHMTWRDLKEYRAHIPKETFAQELVVHAPEYFEDQLIDFASDDLKIRSTSLEMLRLSVEAARALAPHFAGTPGARGPRLVVHPGGHFARPTESNRTEQYRRLEESLDAIDASGVRLLVENMPPFPWYFGGQWYNTIFMDATEVAQFARRSGRGICYDTSHAQLYCNSVGSRLPDFTRKVRPYIQYLHLSDAKGVNEEGLQIGQGDVDFQQLFKDLPDLDVGFVPEVWHGHLDAGKGFRQALSTLETMLAKP